MHYLKRQTFHMQAMLMMAIIATLLMLSGCPATLGVTQKPVSAEDYVQSARAQVGALYKTIGDLRASGQITRERGLSAFQRVAKIEADVDLAEGVMKGGDPKGAQGSLQLALTGLLAIQAELKPKP